MVLDGQETYFQPGCRIREDQPVFGAPVIQPLLGGLELPDGP